MFFILGIQLVSFVIAAATSTAYLTKKKINFNITKIWQFFFCNFWKFESTYRLHDLRNLGRLRGHHRMTFRRQIYYGSLLRIEPSQSIWDWQLVWPLEGHPLDLWLLRRLRTWKRCMPFLCYSYGLWEKTKEKINDSKFRINEFENISLCI